MVPRFLREKSLYWPPSGGSPGDKSRLNTLRVSANPKCQKNLNIVTNIKGVVSTPFLFSAPVFSLFKASKKKSQQGSYVCVVS